MAGSRFIAAGAILMGLMALLGCPLPNRHHWRTALITGLFLFVGGNATVVWSSRSLPSGVVALIIGITPLYAALLEWLWFRGIRPGRLTWLALLAGFSGVALLTLTAATPGHPLDPWAIMAVLAAAFSWTVGSLWSRGAPQTPSPFMNAASQMVAGGSALMLLSWGIGEWTEFRIDQVSAVSWWSQIYLIGFGSLIGFTGFIYTLHHTTGALATSYAYVNPLIAVLVGALLGGEVIEGEVIAASLLIIGAVAGLTLANSRHRSPPEGP